MALDNLVEYFNDRFGHEHRSGLRPFFLKDGKVCGLFGPIRIDGFFKPLRQASNPAVIAGHAAQITVTTDQTLRLNANDIDALLTNQSVSATDFESIIHFDRLSRTVHMLNYLKLAHLEGVLFLEVDPRHILGIKKDHGAYFEEVIAQCGLKTNHVAIVLAVNGQYGRYYRELTGGLENYRRRGYQTVLKFDYLDQKTEEFELIAKISPDYVSLSARHLEDKLHDESLPEELHRLNARISAVGSKTLLQQIDERKTDSLARMADFDLVEGSYYRSITFDYLSKSKPLHYDSKFMKNPSGDYAEAGFFHGISKNQ